MTMQFRPAARSEAKPLIGIYAESGQGKTYSSLLLARGFVGPQGKIGMIETESGRGEAFADPHEYPEIGGYQVLSLRDDFSPKAYGQAIDAAAKEKFGALIIDSASHEWEGSGGVLDMAQKNKTAGKSAMLVWQEPKQDHNRYFMLKLMQSPIPLVIVCMRAKYPMIERPKRDGSGKEWVRSEKLEPKQAEDILYEMFLHAWIDDGYKLRVTKYTTKGLEQAVVNGEPITLETGKRLADWSRKAAAPAHATPAPASTTTTAETGKKTPAAIIAEIEKAPTAEAVDDITKRESAALSYLHENRPETYEKIMEAATLRKGAFRE